MSNANETTFTPRYFECEPWEGLHSLYYVRYLIQLAAEASELAPEGTPRLRGDALRWQLIDLGVRVHEPIQYGDQINARTWLKRPGGADWRWDTVLSRAGQPIVEGFTAWARAAESDEERVRAYEARLDALGPQPTPLAWDDSLEYDPDPPPGAFEAVWRVAPAHLDASGEMDPAWYMSILRMVEANAAALAGWGEDRLQMEGLAWQLREFRLEMLTGAAAEQELRIKSYVGETAGAEVTRHAVISLPDGEVAAFARTRWRCLDAATSEPRDVPEDWLLDLGLQLADLRDDEEA